MISHKAAVSLRMQSMAKKTGVGSSYLWIITILLLALAAWTYFKN